MRKIKVLVVDDAVVVRKIVTDTLGSVPRLKLLLQPQTEKWLSKKLSHRNPDILTLDIEMPEIDGIETFTEARNLYKYLPIIMFSTLTEGGGSKTLEALSLGATDYVTEPANIGSVSIAKKRIRDELISKMKMFCAGKAGIKNPSI